MKALLTEARLIDLLNKPGGKVLCLCMILKTIRSLEEKDGHYTHTAPAQGVELRGGKVL